jgi:hypothetical protein
MHFDAPVRKVRLASLIQLICQRSVRIRQHNVGFFQQGDLGAGSVDLDVFVTQFAHELLFRPCNFLPQVRELAVQRSAYKQKQSNETNKG